MYSRLIEPFKHKLEELGYPLGRYGLHSLCAGLATAAVNVGVPDQEAWAFKRHGRWKSENTKDGFADGSVQCRPA